ncbi:hypothetical protein [Petrachloros mirabilis]
MPYLIAEYCCSQFYHGWHLYQRDRNDGSRNDDPWDWWGWLRGDFRHQEIYDLLVSAGYDPPKPKWHSQELAEWFAANLPNGLEVENGETGYRLIQIVDRRPRQRRRCVRTIRGAAMSQAAFDKLPV